MSIFFRMRGGVKVPRVKGVGAMVDDGHRHIPHSPPVLLASICNKEDSHNIKLSLNFWWGHEIFGSNYSRWGSRNIFGNFLWDGVG